MLMANTVAAAERVSASR
ncbi:MAG: hypothetical protein FWH45_01300 [Methanomassiliicoccaceae archaeon]|nr:hypothetical protein [Methanomassiliicoccaceae archaeon]